MGKGNHGARTPPPKRKKRGESRKHEGYGEEVRTKKGEIGGLTGTRKNRPNGRHYRQGKGLITAVGITKKRWEKKEEKKSVLDSQRDTSGDDLQKAKGSKFHARGDKKWEV